MNTSALEACHADLFSDKEVLDRKYPADTVDKVLRVRDMYLTFLKTPSLTDAAAVRQLTTRYKVSRPTAYSDVAVVKGLLPMLGQEARDFHRWRAKEMLLETYRTAAAKNDVRTMEHIASSYARVFNVAHEDEQAIPIDQIIPQPWVPTDDPSVLGILPMPDRDKRIRELIAELSSKTPDILDITFEDADIRTGSPD